MFLCLLFSEEKNFTAEFFCLADCSNNFGAVIADFNGNKEFEKSTASKKKKKTDPSIVIGYRPPTFRQLANCFVYNLVY